MIDKETKVSPVLVEARDLKVGFRQQLSLYLDAQLAAHADPLKVARAVSTELETRVLIADDSDDPYAMTLVQADREPERVSLDVATIDERGEYKLARESGG